MGWLLVLGLKEGLVECATVCIKSEVILVKVQKRVIDNISASIGIMSFLKQVLILACIFASCNSQGAPWSEEETAIIYKKVEKTINFSTSGMVRNRYLQLHPEAPNYHPKTNPNPPKVINFS